MVSKWCHSTYKRILDFLLALGLLLVASPFLLLIGLLTKLSSQGPVLFRQKRLGKNGKPFTIYKFRTMENGPSDWPSNITIVGDPRITAFGRLLRKWKLDELPQLTNVLRGEMAFVGPRPKLPHLELKNAVTLAVRPGITGVATLAFRNEERLLEGLSPQEIEAFYVSTIAPLKVQLDREYLGRASLFTDLKIIYRTVLSVIKYPGHSPSNLEELASLCGSYASEATSEYHWAFSSAQTEAEGSFSR